MVKFALCLDDEIEKHGVVRDFEESIEMPEGFFFKVFTDPGEAYRFVETEGDKVHLIISDYVMPVIDGLGFLKSTKALTKKPKLILISNLNNIEELKREKDIAGVYKKETPLVDLVQKIVFKFLR